MAASNPIGLYLAAMIGVAAFASPVGAQTAPKKPGLQFKSSSWEFACKAIGKKKIRVCRLTQAITQTGTGKSLLLTSIRKTTGAKPFVMQFRLPHGLHIPAGVDVSIDGAKKGKLPVFTSDPRGTYTSMALDKKLVSALKKGKIMKVVMLTSRRQKISVAVALKGFTAGFDKLAR